MKHGERGTRGWKKLHLGVDGSGAFVARLLTDGIADDAKTAIYEAAGARGATVVVPPTKTAAVSRRGPRPSVRDRTIMTVKQIGRRRWKTESGSHRRARVENAFFRCTSIIGDRLRTRTRRPRTLKP